MPSTARPRARHRPVRGVLRAALTAAVAVGVFAATPGIAAADPGGVGGVGGMGSGQTGAAGAGMPGGTDLGLPAAANAALGLVGPGTVTNLLDSSYPLTDLDPVTGALTGASVTDALTDDYATAAALSDSSSFMAIDMAQMSVQAQQQAEAALAQQQKRQGLKNVPAPYDTYILNGIAQYCPTLEPSILAAQINQESGFNPKATSPAGALGIAQFMPGTWSTHGVDGNGDGKKDVWDPADAIPAAAKYDCSLRTAVRNVPGDPTSNMLAAYNAGPGAVLKYNGIPPYTETQNYVQSIEASAANFASDTGGQSAVGPDGCPTSVPGNTLRDGSASVGAQKLCADSVAQARTPAAALAIKWALNHLGIPYSQQYRMTGKYYDCSSFVSAAYKQGAGLDIYSSWAPTTYAIHDAKWAVTESFSAVRPGDLVEPEPGHVTMALADGYKVHTNMDGDVSKVEKQYTSAWWSAWVDPARV